VTKINKPQEIGHEIASETCQGNWAESGSPAEGRLLWLPAPVSMLSKGERSPPTT